MQRFAETPEDHTRLQEEINLGIGRQAANLIILAQLHGTDFEECLTMAYDEIKGRTGKMIDGVFVKDQPKGESK